MARRSRRDTPEVLRQKLVELLDGFKDELKKPDLRRKVLALIPVNYLLKDLGNSLIPNEDANSARDRILFYFQKYPFTIINGEELMVVAGISEWARRVRELRVEFGWSVATGVTLKEMITEEVQINPGLDLSSMKPYEYILLSHEQDRDAAHRWNIANAIRKKKDISVRDKILEFLKANVSKPVTGEELRYVAGDKTEWARRVRELRTECGWSVVTKNTGRPDLPIGTYLLESVKQLPAHDRIIPDSIRGDVLMRDKYTCQEKRCGWNYSVWNPSDPRNLELHHIKHHADKGENAEDNLVILCNVCHDKKHKK